MNRLSYNKCAFKDSSETFDNAPQVRIATAETLDFPESYIQKIQNQDKGLDIVKN